MLFVLTKPPKKKKKPLPLQWRHIFPRPIQSQRDAEIHKIAVERTATLLGLTIILQFHILSGCDNGATLSATHCWHWQKNKDRRSKDHSPAIKIFLQGSNVIYVSERVSVRRLSCCKALAWRCFIPTWLGRRDHSSPVRKEVAWSDMKAKRKFRGIKEEAHASGSLAMHYGWIFTNIVKV